MNRWESKYDVTADYLPFRHWYIMADGEAAARLKVKELTGIPMEQLSAALTTSSN